MARTLFSDRNLLIGGILLLLVNIALNLPKFSKSREQLITHKDSAWAEPSYALQQAFKGGLIIPLLQWNEKTMATNEAGQAIPFDQLLATHNKLILRFSELSCNTCVDREVTHLKKMAEKYGPEKVMILTTYHQLRDLIAFKRTNQIPFEVYNIDENLFSPEMAGGTFLFMANKNAKAFMPFLPDKDDGSISEHYYHFVEPMLKGH